ncbi:MAG: hypothetical protein HC897_03325 [Thermoanaerobaculia bacterium]|nr:hypothetical protein [Thermoanaerobaculia bacterium]
MVVYEESKRGRQLFQVVASGDFFRQPLLSFGKRFVAYWVIADPHLKLSSERECKTRDHVYKFSLKIIVFYHVKLPEALVERIDADPLERLRERAEELMLRQVARLDWQTIKEGGEAFQAIVSREDGTGEPGVRSCLDQLRAFAMDYGIGVTSLAIERSLPDDEIATSSRSKKSKPNAASSEPKPRSISRSKNTSRLSRCAG